MGAAIPYLIMGGASVLSSAMTKSSADKATAQAKAASEAEQAYNEKVLTEQRNAAVLQRNAALLENQANLNTAKVETAGAAAASEEAGYSGSEIRRKKANMTRVSSSLGF